MGEERKTKKFDRSQPKSLGLTIVMTLVKQLKRTVEVRRKGGTEIVIRCPYAQPNGLGPVSSENQASAL